MAFSLLGAAGGFTEKVSAGWAEKRRDQALKKAAMLQIVMPEAMRLRNKRRDKKDTFKTMFRKLKNYLPNDPNLAMGLLESGIDYTNNWIKEVDEYRAKVPKGHTISEINILKAAGMLDKDYVRPERTDSFEDWWSNTMVGKAGDHAVPNQENSLKTAMQRQFGTLSSDQLRDEVYGDVATASGMPFKGVVADLAGTRIKTPSGFADAIRLPISEYDKNEFNLKVEVQKTNMLIAKRTMKIDDEEVPLALGIMLTNNEKTKSEIRKNDAIAAYNRGRKGVTSSASLDKYMNKYTTVSKTFSKTLASRVGYEFIQVDGVWQFKPEGADEDQNRLKVIEQSLSLANKAYGNYGRKLFDQGKPALHSLDKITSSLMAPHSVSNILINSAAYLDAYASQTSANGELTTKHFDSIKAYVGDVALATGVYDGYVQGFMSNPDWTTNETSDGTSITPAPPKRVPETKEGTLKKQTATLQSALDNVVEGTSSSLLPVRTALTDALNSAIKNNPNLAKLTADDILENRDIGVQLGLTTSLSKAIIENRGEIIGAVSKLSAPDFKISAKAEPPKVEVEAKKIKPLGGSLIDRAQAAQATKDAEEEEKRQAAENRRLEQERLLAEQQRSILKPEDTELSIQDSLEETREWAEQLENPDNMTEDNIAVMTERVISFLELAKKNNLLAFSKKYMDMSGKEMLEDKAIGEYLIGSGYTLKEAINSSENIMYLVMALQDIVGGAYKTDGQWYVRNEASPVKAPRALGARSQ